MSRIDEHGFLVDDDGMLIDPTEPRKDQTSPTPQGQPSILDRLKKVTANDVIALGPRIAAYGNKALPPEVAPVMNMIPGAGIPNALGGLKGIAEKASVPFELANQGSKAIADFLDAHPTLKHVVDVAIPSTVRAGVEHIPYTEKLPTWLGGEGKPLTGTEIGNKIMSLPMVLGHKVREFADEKIGPPTPGGSREALEDIAEIVGPLLLTHKLMKGVVGDGVDINNPTPTLDKFTLKPGYTAGQAFIDMKSEARGGINTATDNAKGFFARNDIAPSQREAVVNAIESSKPGEFNTEQIRKIRSNFREYNDDVLRRGIATGQIDPDVEGADDGSWAKTHAAKLLGKEEGELVDDPLLATAISDAGIRKGIATNKFIKHINDSIGQNELVRDNQGKLPDGTTLFDFKNGVEVSGTAADDIIQNSEPPIHPDDPFEQGSNTYHAIPKEIVKGLDEAWKRGDPYDNKMMKWANNIDNKLTSIYTNPAVNAGFNGYLTIEHILSGLYQAPMQKMGGIPIPGSGQVNFLRSLAPDAVNLSKNFWDLYVKGKPSPLIEGLRENALMSPHALTDLDIGDSLQGPKGGLRAITIDGITPVQGAKAVLTTADKFNQAFADTRESAVRQALVDSIKKAEPEMSDEGAIALANRKMGNYSRRGPVDIALAPVTRFTKFWSNLTAEMTTRLFMDPITQKYGVLPNAKAFWLSPYPNLMVAAAGLYLINHRNEETSKIWDDLPLDKKFTYITGAKTEDGKPIIVDAVPLLTQVTRAGQAAIRTAQGHPWEGMGFWAGRVSPQLRVPFELGTGVKARTAAPIIPEVEKNMPDEMRTQLQLMRGRSGLDPTVDYTLSQFAPNAIPILNWLKMKGDQPLTEAMTPIPGAPKRSWSESLHGLGVPVEEVSPDAKMWEERRVFGNDKLTSRNQAILNYTKATTDMQREAALKQAKEDTAWLLAHKYTQRALTESWKKINRTLARENIKHP